MKVEVHTYLLSPYKYPLFNSYSVWQRRKHEIINGNISVQVLNCNDDFIYSACHMCKHIINGIVNNVNTKNLTEWEISRKFIDDAVLMLEKWPLEWDDIIKHSVEWGVINELAFLCRLINENNCDLIPSGVYSVIIGKAYLDNEKGKYKSLLHDILFAERLMKKNTEIVKYILSADSGRIYTDSFVVKNGRMLIESEYGRLELLFKENFLIKYRNNSDLRAVIKFSISSEVNLLETLTLYIDFSKCIITENTAQIFENNRTTLKFADFKVTNDGYMVELQKDIVKIMDNGNEKYVGISCHIVYLDKNKDVVHRDYLCGLSSYYSFYNMVRFVL